MLIPSLFFVAGFKRKGRRSVSPDPKRIRVETGRDAALVRERLVKLQAAQSSVPGRQSEAPEGGAAAGGATGGVPKIKFQIKPCPVRQKLLMKHVKYVGSRKCSSFVFLVKFSFFVFLTFFPFSSSASD